MSDSFNAHHVWLGIPLSEQPPNHYRLLGISVFESDLDVIDHAADRQMAHVRTFQSGRHGALSQQILNELASARVCLLSPNKKSDYDSTLRAKLSAAPIIAAVPVGRAVPVMPTAQAVAPLAAKPLAAPPAPPAATSPPVAPARPASRVSGDGDDPFGLRAASGRRPVAAQGSDTLFDDAEIANNARINVDLNRRSASSDIFMQRLAIYAFIGVACFVVLMVIWNTLTKNYGPPSEWLKSPVATEPVHEPPKHQPAPAPAPSVHDAAADASAPSE